VVGPIPESSLFNACRILFGAEIELSRDFLFYLQPSGVKAAYRQQAKQSHPDTIAHCSAADQRQQGDRFRQVTEAYQLICAFFKQREAGIWRQERQSLLDRMASSRRPPKPQPLYYNGQLPARPLEIGRYLYYRGAIPYQALIQALGMQRRQRPSIGRIARSWGWLSGEGVNAILYCQGHEGRFGEKAAHLGLLNQLQIDTILNYQKTRQKKLGQYFVQMGYLSHQQMERLAHDLHRHNACHPCPDPAAAPALARSAGRTGASAT
jgi:hypothetical protein